MEQRSESWFAARCGSLGASQVHDALAKTKTGWGASRANLRARLVAERLTGNPQDSFSNTAMQWGVDNEDEARTAYQWHTGSMVIEVGLYTHPTIKGTHASPDGEIGVSGLIEIKCPNTATHIETLKSQSVASKYITQMQWQMACTDRQWCDFVSYDPRMPEDLQLFVQRIERDNDFITATEEQVRVFLNEVQSDIDALMEIRNGKSK